MSEEIASPSLDEPRSAPRFAWGRMLVWVFLGGLLLLLFFGLLRTQGTNVRIGKPAPDFTLTTYDGQEIRLSALRGKVVLINFWASWCKPCEDEAEELEEAWRYFQPRGDVLFLGIAWTDTEEKSLAYLQRFGITYPNGADMGTRISQLYRITGVPETYIVDRQGKLVYIKISPFQSTQEIIDAVTPYLEQ